MSEKHYQIVDIEVNPGVLAPITIGSVSYTPDMIKTYYDKIPNFGGYPTLLVHKSGNWSEVVRKGGTADGTRGRQPRMSAAEVEAMGDQAIYVDPLDCGADECG